MKKIIAALSLIIVVLTGTSAYMLRYSSGIAGYTASPGEVSCNSCHNGGVVDSAAAITMSTSPAFSNNTYSPGAVYDISVHVSAAGYSKFGFDCEILNGSHVSTGTMQVMGTDVQLLNAGGRINVTHTGPKPGTNSATFSFQWLAPASGEGAVSFYIAGNSVNGDHSINGDFPVPPVSFTLIEGSAVVTPTLITDTLIVDDPVVATGLKTQGQHVISQVTIYPDPVTLGSANFSCSLIRPQLVVAELLSLQGMPVKILLRETLLQGYTTKMLNLQDVESGVYFIRISVNGQNASQKLIIVQ